MRFSVSLCPFTCTASPIINSLHRVVHLLQLMNLHCCSVPESCHSVTSWTAACQASWSFTFTQSLLKLTSLESVMPSNHLILCRPLVLPPSIFPSIRVFSSESVLRIRWPKYWSFSFNITNEHSGLISFRKDLLDLLAVQGTLKRLLQHHVQKHQFFGTQLSL